MAEAETETKVVEGTANGTCLPDDTGLSEGTSEAETVKKEEAVTVKKEDTTEVKEMEEDSIENEKNGAVGKHEDHNMKEEERKQEKEREENELEDVKMEEETETKEEKERKEIVENADEKEEKESEENVVAAQEKEEKEDRKENTETAQEKEENESKENIENAEENREERVKAKPSKGEKQYTKRGKGSNVGGKEVGKQNEVDEKRVKATNTPMASSLDRPVRERKSVERLVVSIEKEPAKDFHIEKGRGTPLKEIPNVAYKLSRKKTEETFKSLYMILFGRRGKASDVKKNISQFSGFVWHENEEKQRMKLKEKFDKCFKEKLLEFCDVLDISVSKTATRKEDIVVKLIDFLAAPHATTDVLIAEKEQSIKDSKRKRSVRGTSSKSGGASAKSSSRKRRKSEDTPKGKDKKSAPDIEDESKEEEDEENDNGIPDAPEEVLNCYENEDREDESVEESEEDMVKHKRGLRKSSSKKESAGKTSMKKCTTSRKATPITSPKETLRKSSSSKHAEVNDSTDKGPKVFSRKKKNEETRKKASNPVKSATKEKAGKNVVKGKDKSREEEPGPSEDELRGTICEILKEVDFNTATFTDILKLLARRFNTDLTTKKSAIKLLIQEELTKLADEAEDNGDDEGDERYIDEQCCNLLLSIHCRQKRFSEPASIVEFARTLLPIGCQYATTGAFPARHKLRRSVSVQILPQKTVEILRLFSFSRLTTSAIY
ncbi:hypothetical protein NE237_001125 [Protea cynaroides]|uniref:DEK-C domain-containing protein n=1 Tax=Protea cynaroides TaxID=273540 RepID=A0A9Q0QY47_9MAGN|nr:hypothetical protein NE237_001125 [Protea cynaroides]